MIKLLFAILIISLFTTIGLINEMGNTNWIYVAISALIGAGAFMQIIMTVIQNDERLDNE